MGATFTVTTGLSILISSNITISIVTCNVFIPEFSIPELEP